MGLIWDDWFKNLGLEFGTGSCEASRTRRTGNGRIHIGAQESFSSENKIVSSRNKVFPVEIKLYAAEIKFSPLEIKLCLALVGHRMNGSINRATISTEWTDQRIQGTTNFASYDGRGSIG